MLSYMPQGWNALSSFASVCAIRGSVTGAAIKGAFVKGIVDAFVEHRPASSGDDLITSQHVIKECTSKSSKKASKKETVKTTGNKLMNIIIKVLSDSGIEPMLALELAQKINEKICKEDE